jgi:hypothetical protein
VNNGRGSLENCVCVLGQFEPTKLFLPTVAIACIRTIIAVREERGHMYLKLDRLMSEILGPQFIKVSGRHFDDLEIAP